MDAGDSSDLHVNGIGFDVESDMLYGICFGGGTDALGNTVNSGDIVSVDAKGLAYRVGEGPGSRDYIGDFDDSGNLWTFQGSLDRISITDVDDIDASGNPTTRNIDLPNDAFTDSIHDIAFSASDNSFYAVVAPRLNGGEGKLVRIDLDGVESGGAPQLTEIPITGTLYGDDMETGMASGSHGAVFMDGDGNIYYGLNSGDHDLDSGTANTGGIFKVHADWENGTAHSEFMSEAQNTGRNDGAVDPRSSDAFEEIDPDAAVLLRGVEMVEKADEGDDTVDGGAGDDEIHGNGGADRLSGGEDDDHVDGGDGDDTVMGDGGDDTLHGGDGDDLIQAGSGQDLVEGGAGADTISNVNAGDRVDGGHTGTDADVLDLTGSASSGGSLRVIRSGPDSDGNGMDGEVRYYDNSGALEGTLTFTNIESLVPCFTPGTRIVTERGNIPVEALRLGDRVLTRDNAFQPVVWIGRKSLSRRRLAQTP